MVLLVMAVGVTTTAIAVVVPELSNRAIRVPQLALQCAALMPIEIAVTTEATLQLRDMAILLAQMLGLLAREIAALHAVPDALMLAIDTLFEMPATMIIGHDRRRHQPKQWQYHNKF